MTTYNINEMTVQGLDQALQNAVERWEAAGAPCPTDSQREAIRAAVAGELHPSQAKEIYRGIVNYTADADLAKAQAEKRAAMERAQAATNALRSQLVAELKDVRAQTGQTMDGMAALLSVAGHVIRNAEANHGLSVQRFEQLLVGYRAVLQGMQPPVIERGKSGPRSRAEA